MSIYINQNPQFCVYLTIYSGTKLPPFYIGYSIIKKVKSGYHGSVVSKKYSQIWKQELKENPHLFKTIILYTFYSKKNAIYHERLLQIRFNVAKSDQFINMGISHSKSCYGIGRDISGNNNPMKNPETRKKVSETLKTNLTCSGENNPMWGKIREDTQKYMKERNPGKIKCCCYICKKETNITGLTRFHKHFI